jgi:multiple sugar transport system substrate-binding protein
LQSQRLIRYSFENTKWTGDFVDRRLKSFVRIENNILALNQNKKCFLIEEENKSMTKRISLMLVLVFVLTALALPTYAQDDAWADVDPSGQEIVFWYRVTGSTEEALQGLIAEFNETNEWGIVVEGITQGGYTELADKMLLTIGTDDAPNVIIAYQNNQLDYYTLDGLAVLNDLAASPTWGLTEEDLSDFFPAFLGQDVYANFGGVRLGMPPQRSMAVMYHNIDWLNELYENGHVDFEGMPTTPEQFMTAACAAVENPFSGATGDPELSQGYSIYVDASQVASWVFAFGGDIYDYENNVFTYDTEEVIAAMQFVSDLFANDCAYSYGYREDQAAFGQGLVLFGSSSSSGLPYWKGNIEEGYAGDWSVAAYPYVGDEPAMNVYGASVSVGAGDPEEVLASWLFVKYLTSTDVSAAWTEASNYFPMRQSSADKLSDYFASNEAFVAAFDLLPYGMFEPPVPGYDSVRRELGDYIVRIIEGEDVTEVMTEFNEIANEILMDAMSAFE